MALDLLFAHLLAETMNDAKWAMNGSYLDGFSRKYWMHVLSASSQGSIICLCSRYCQILQSIRQIMEYELASQLLRSGTSIGANIQEALRAQSEKDFIAKMSIAHKEAGETEFWLQLLVTCKIAGAQSLRKPLDSIIRTLCATLKKLHLRTDA